MECHEEGPPLRRHSPVPKILSGRRPEVKYVGVDWAYRTTRWCALAPGGEIAGEGRIAADRDGLARLVLELGDEVKACLARSTASRDRRGSSPTVDSPPASTTPVTVERAAAR